MECTLQTVDKVILGALHCGMRLTLPLIKPVSVLPAGAKDSRRLINKAVSNAAILLRK